MARPYPERRDEATGVLDRAGHAVRLWCRKARTIQTQRAFLREVDRVGRELSGGAAIKLDGLIEHLRRRLVTHGARAHLVAETFALVREVAERTIGQRHYPVQLIGGRALFDGFACEMETGEGKTLTATLPAATAALSGRRVHVITVNDYLAARDVRAMEPIYQRLGITVGLVTHESSPEDRRRAYSAGVTYCSNKELVFDYLRDQLVLGDRDSRLHLLLEQLGGEVRRESELLLRGLDFAIVDELDSVLIDEARTPLVLSRSTDGDENPYAYRWAATMADALRAGEHYQVNAGRERLELTDLGRSELLRLAGEGSNVDDVWRFAREREQRILQALTAKNLYQRDRDYIVRENTIEIVDRNTGRALPDRSWEQGLHQAVEAKEGVELRSGQAPIVRMTYQRFFRRYIHLCGMTGTAQEASTELRRVYGLTPYRVPTHRVLRRRAAPLEAYWTQEAKWVAVMDRIEELHRRRLPVLVGTRSVETSEFLGKQLRERGLEVQILNARQDREENEVIARAGKPGAITVATDIAGRGTDIQIGDEVARLGGLHVVAVEPHESRRVDRQLFGRCARQGDPGCFERFVSLDDELFEKFAQKLVEKIRVRWPDRDSPPPLWMVERLIGHAQRVAERHRYECRRQLLTLDDRKDAELRFAGHETGSRRSRTKSTEEVLS